jgi:cytochrome c oxidase subunit 3
VAIAREAGSSGLSKLWGGGVHPYGVSHKKFGMWLFLASDSLTFAALIFGYAYLRNASHSWPTPFEFYPSIVVSTVMTFCLLFLVLHANEWRELIHHGMTPGNNPWGDPMFGATFFTMTGLHMFHVLTGVVYLGYVAMNHSRGKTEHDSVEVCGLYWHFVDLVWMFIFPLVYLMSVNMGAAAPH